jgi:hypothetical protein
MSRTEWILRLMERGASSGCGLREAIAATEDRKDKGDIPKNWRGGNESMRRRLMAHRVGRVERPRERRNNRRQHVTVPEVLSDSPEKRRQDAALPPTNLD